MIQKKLLFLLIFLSLSISPTTYSVTTTSSSTTRQTKDLIIRVLLDEYSTLKKKKISIISQNGIIIESPMGSKQCYKTKRNILNIIIKNNKLYLQCEDGIYRKIKHNDIALSPVKGILHIDNKSYKGTIDLRIDTKGNVLQLINKLALNDYIYSVLRYESLSYWPLEMQKVQAVASRTYAIYQMKLTRKQKRSKKLYYDIKNTNFHQVYNGNHKYIHLQKAVHSTNNEILTYNNDIALTMFDICCGGAIPYHMKNKDKEKPYLFRKNRCTFCRKKSNFNWKETFNVRTFSRHLKQNHRIAKKLRLIKNIVGIRVHEKDKAGIAHTIEIAGEKRNITISIQDLKTSLPNNLKSMMFNIQKRDNKIIIAGTGFGHNIGLCQLGARELVSRGWNYKRILNFYYPKTKLKRLK